MASTPEDAVAALVAQIAAALAVSVPGALVLDEDAGAPVDELPPEGQVAVFLADRGLPVEINGEGPYHREVEVTVECLVQGETGAERRERLRRLIGAVEAAVDADRSLGGEIDDCDREALDPRHVPVQGAAGMLGESILMVLEFQSATRI